MLSSDKNVESIKQLVESLRQYAILQKEYVKLDVIEKIVQLVTAMTLVVVLIILGVAVLFYLTFAVVYWMAPAIGTATAFLIVAVAFLLLLLLVFANRKKWIERPLVRFLSQLLLS